jgi:hypothetical protein
MIITRITSGLGNQLFQYAVGRSLALQNKTSLYFDLSYYRQSYETDTLRAFKLDRFNIEYEVLNTSPYVYVSKFTKLLPHRTLKPLFRFVQEKQFHFDARVTKASAAFVTLDGFWQSERYFGENEPLIRQDLQFTCATGETFARYQAEIEQHQYPVSMHIRRGDYVNHPEFSKSFGFLGLDYYRVAIALLRERFSTFKLFIFSDDPEWVRENLLTDADYTLVVNTGADADLNDLQLMSLCRHHVIANSSFSWWGAWLNADPDKVVIAPKIWFRDKPDWNTADLVPTSWLRV